MPPLTTLCDGDRRVWRWAAIAGVPLAVFVIVWCLVPRPYFTGTDSVNALSVSPLVSSRVVACQAGLRIPAGTSRIELGIASASPRRPALRLTAVTASGSIVAAAPAAAAPVGRVQHVDFPLGRTVGRTVPASVCVTPQGGGVTVAGTPTLQAIIPPLRVAGHDTVLRLAVWYRPPAGAARSYVGELGAMFDRAALLAAGFLAPWMLWVLFLLVLPAMALLAVRCLARAAAGHSRRLALWLFVLAFVNAAAWSVITPAFQGPDEVDHFAYVQSLAEHGAKPSPYPATPLARWSSAETDALLGSGMLTDHQLDDSRAPGLSADRDAYSSLVARGHPRAGDGGGLQTTSGYGPLYYLALAPGYLVASGGSPFSQLEAARLISSLIGALACLFTFLAVREIAPRRPFLAVVAALLVAFQPMYSFLSGTINNDVGIDAGAAALAWLLFRLLRRGPELRSAIAVGALAGVLPFVKDSAFELYPLVALALAGVVWRARGWRREARRPVALAVGALVVCFLIAYGAASALDGALTPGAPTPGAAKSVATAGGSLSVVLHHPGAYLVYLWEVFLPRLPGMTPHFGTPGLPAQTIITRRAWAAFGWYDTFFPSWVYTVLDVAMLGALVLGALALWRERAAVRVRGAETLLVIAFPIVVVAAFEAVFFTTAQRPLIAEMGRYVFPALTALAAAAVGVLFAFGRRRLPAVGTVLTVVMIAFCFASQALTMTAFFS